MEAALSFCNNLILEVMYYLLLNYIAPWKESYDKP